MAGMPIPSDETKRYSDFAVQLTRELGAMEITPNTILWHYTNGAAFLAIVDSMSIFPATFHASTTQASCATQLSFFEKPLQP